MLYSFVIFIIVVLLYVHIVSHFKKSQEMEIYETDYISNTEIQKVCDLKQPVLFNIQTIVPEIFDGFQLKGGSHEVHVKDTKENDTGNYFVLPFSSSRALIETDDKGRYFSENNYEMTEELSDKRFNALDDLLKPGFIIQNIRDIMYGSKSSYTPVRYTTNYREFICVLSGKIRLKLTPYKSSKFLYPKIDYIHGEKRSPVDVWNPQSQFLNEMDKLQFLEFDVSAGNVFYLPPYWFYSIKYLDDETYMYKVVYNSPMNVLANSPNLIMSYLSGLSKSEPGIVPEIPNKKVVSNIMDDNNKLDIPETENM
jgi:hypothetical protein